MTLDRMLRARQAAHRCEEQAAGFRARATRCATEQVRGDWLALAEESENLAAEWRAQLARLEAERPRRQCTCCPKRALPGRYECAEHDDDLPYGQPVDSDPATPGTVHSFV